MAHVLTRERLGIAGERKAGVSHWRDQDPLRAAELVRREVLAEGTCLPMVWFCDGLVIPVVTWDLDALHLRLENSGAPILYRSVLADRLAHDRDHLEPAVLRMRAFISVHALPGARSALGAVSGFAQAIAAIPRPPGASGWDAFEADYYGFTVAEVDNMGGVRTVVQGRREPKHPQGGPGPQRRLMEEQLFDVAVRTGTTPSA